MPGVRRGRAAAAARCAAGATSRSRRGRAGPGLAQHQHAVRRPEQADDRSRTAALTTPETPTATQQTRPASRTARARGPAPGRRRAVLGPAGVTASPAGEQPTDPQRGADHVDHQARDGELVAAGGRGVPGQGRRHERERGQHGGRNARLEVSAERATRATTSASTTWASSARPCGIWVTKLRRMVGVERLSGRDAEDVGDGERQLDGGGQRPHQGGPHREPARGEPGPGQHRGGGGQQEARGEQQPDGREAERGRRPAGPAAAPSR